MYGHYTDKKTYNNVTIQMYNCCVHNVQGYILLIKLLVQDVVTWQSHDGHMTVQTWLCGVCCTLSALTPEVDLRF